ncbi:MAG TPA: hypothetical protein DEA44_09565 [Firmicutes bacterium]|nr:hypothetical protein [Bacillota bacterium]
MAVVFRPLVIILLVAEIFAFSSFGSINHVLAAALYTVPEIKLFTLRQKDVIAVAVEERLAGTAPDDPLAYMLEPRYRIIPGDTKTEVVLANVAATGVLQELAIPGGRLSMSVKGSCLQKIELENTGPDQIRLIARHSAGEQAKITLVKRKRYLNPDNTITFRTYIVLSVSKAAEPAPRIIVLDPGHGGDDPGATGNYLYEKDLNLDISLLARELFLQKGYDVYLTRMDDSPVELLDRADAANILGAAAFISVHNNSMPADMPEPAQRLYKGTTVLFNSAAMRPAKDLAVLMCDELVGTLRTHKYPLQDRPKLVVLNATWVPAVLAEVAMLPNPQDAKMISQRVYRLQAAEAIVNATDKYLSFRVAGPVKGKGDR